MTHCYSYSDTLHSRAAHSENKLFVDDVMMMTIFCAVSCTRHARANHYISPRW